MKIIVNHLALEYQKTGNGPVVLVLHGWGTSHKDMQSVVDALTSAYTVIAVDLPGFGASEVPPSSWGVRDYAQTMRMLLEKLGVRELEGLVGHSFGGRVTIKAIGEGILAPKRVTLIGSAGVKHSASLRNRTYKMIAKTGKTVLALPGLKSLSARARVALYRSAGSQDYIHSGAMRDVFVRTINEDLSALARKNTLPTLLIWGDQDTEAPLKDGEFFHSVMPKSTLKVATGAGHFVHNERESEVRAWLKEFWQC